MSRIELYQTTAFRLAIVFSALFGVLAAAVFALIYWTHTSFVEAQTEQRLQRTTNALIQHYQRQGLPALIEAVRVRSANAHLVNVHYVLADETGRYIAGNLVKWPEEVEFGEGNERFRRAADLPPRGAIDWDRDTHYEVAARATRLDNGYRLLVGIGLYESAEFREQSLAGLIVGSGITIGLALLVGAVLGRTMLARVDAIDSALADVMSGDLSRRIAPSRRHDEFARLASRVNHMLDRIEGLVGSLRAVTSNVSHDLRTPLHRLRSRIERLLLSSDLPDDQQNTMASAIHDIDEILATFRDLLAIAEAESGSQAVEFEEVDVTRVTHDVSELYAAAAEDRDLRFAWHCDAGVTAWGKASLLSQALSNILDNAIKFTPAGGEVTVQLLSCADGFELSVADTGPGIPPDERERVLRPFERLDRARSTPGSGLGLSVAAAIASLHGAELVLADNAPGLQVRLRMRTTRTA